jgi:ABC-type sugar transport system permease subunit
VVGLARGERVLPTPGRRLPRSLAPYLFIAPFFVIFAVFGALPLVLSFAMSLASWRGLTPSGLAGLQNYLRLLGDRDFHTALVNTAVIWLQVPLTLAAALALALVLNARWLRMQPLLRGMIFLPVIVSLVVAGLMFNLLLDQRFGLINGMLASIGLPAIDWRGSELWTKPAVILLTLWRWTGFNMAILLAGLQSIDPILYDAAQVDGSNAWQRFFHVTLPLMRPILLFTAVIATVGSLSAFDEVYVMFGPSGGVQQSAMTTGLLIWRQAFQFGDFGYAAALAYAVGVITLVLVVVEFRVLRPATG